MTLTVMLDVLVAGLLLATIAYAMLLSRRLGALRNDKAQLETLVRSLDDSTRRAEASIAALKQAADVVGQELQKQLDQGKSLRSDLFYVIDLGNTLADRIETKIRNGRDENKPPEAPVAAAGAVAEPRPRKRPSGQPAVEPKLPADRAAAERPPEAGAPDPRVTGFPSRAERLLRRALEARH